MCFDFSFSETQNFNKNYAVGYRTQNIYLFWDKNINSLPNYHYQPCPFLKMQSNIDFLPCILGVYWPALNQSITWKSHWWCVNMCFTMCFNRHNFDVEFHGYTPYMCNYSVSVCVGRINFSLYQLPDHNSQGITHPAYIYLFFFFFFFFLHFRFLVLEVIEHIFGVIEQIESELANTVISRYSQTNQIGYFFVSYRLLFLWPFVIARIFGTNWSISMVGVVR